MNDRKFSSEKDYENKLKSLLEDSKNIALSELYPFLDDFEGVELPTRYYNWQLRASEELYTTQGNAGYKQYSENGLSWSRSSDGVLSYALLNELIQYVGEPKRSDADDNR